MKDEISLCAKTLHLFADIFDKQIAVGKENTQQIANE